jgi:hypothetical protein
MGKNTLRVTCGWLHDKSGTVAPEKNACETCQVASAHETGSAKANPDAVAVAVAAAATS